MPPRLVLSTIAVSSESTSVAVPISREELLNRASTEAAEPRLSPKHVAS